MLRNFVFGATILTLAAVFWLLGELAYLIPYKRLILAHWLPSLAWYFALLWFNFCAGCFAFTRTFLLKDTGRKLAHLEKQLRSGASVSDELSSRLEAE